MKATPQQKQLIHLNAHDRDQKEEFVQWATDDNDKISCNDLSFDQANLILEKLGQKPHKAKRNYYGLFDKKNQQHMAIVSLTRQLGWELKNEKYGRVADMDRLGNWLQSTKAPVSLPLKKMTTQQLTTTINAMTGMVAKRYK
jgi:phage gp16-like protein